MRESGYEEERKVNPDCRNASNPYHECSDYCFKIIATSKKRSNTGSVIRTFLVQKALKEKKEKLMARARASLSMLPPPPAPGPGYISEPHPNATSPPANPDLMDTYGLLLDSSTCVKDTASHKHGEPSHPSSKDEQNTKLNDPKRRSKRVREDGQLGPTELDDALKQLEMQRKVVEDQRSELRDQSGETTRQSSRDRIVPNWNISLQSSVMKTAAGEDSFELYRACLLPMDQLTLAPMVLCKLEEMAAHDLMQVAAVTHQLTLQCSMLQRDQKELAEKVAQLENEKHKLEHLVLELKAWTEKAEKALLKSKTELKRLEQDCADSFNAGRAAGGQEFMESKEYEAALHEARLAGAKDFKNSPTFELILATRAAEYEVIGFMKCQSQILKLGGFKPGFDPGLLDAARDGNFESPTVDDDGDPSVTEDPEFGFLAED